MSDTAKPDSLLMTFLFGHDDWREGLAENGGLSGNETQAYKVDGDDGAAEIPDPVESFCNAVAQNRFGSTPTWDEPISVVEKNETRYSVGGELLGIDKFDRFAYDLSQFVVFV